MPVGVTAFAVLPHRQPPNSPEPDILFLRHTTTVPSMKRLLLVVAVLVVFVGACSSDTEPLIGLRVSSDSAVGDSRLLFAVNEVDGTRRGSPDEVVTVVASPLDEPSRSYESVADFTWIVPNTIGVYRATVPFDTAGLWQIDFAISTGEPTEPFLVDIQASPSSVAIGEPAPLVETRTLADTPIEELTTDDDPVPELYESSLHEVLQNGRKTVVLFATPAFCVSSTCGPLLNQMKHVMPQAPTVDFVHIEVYEGFREPGFVPDAQHLAPAVAEFGLINEPWIFVMDESGIVTSRLEGVLIDGELEEILGVG
ncbi:MAG: hypothetical protein DWP92_00375 [Armatimonadetes bacterium]|nr:MAG: hypothetical protein DWP92_00375 [Armatimonadota bacterium]